jgi:biotin-(acetyl-CoA carboxylase) ligase
MNVNERQFPEEIPNATSIYNATGIKHDLYEVASLLRHHVLENVDVSDLYWKQTYDMKLFGINKEYEFDLRGKSIYAKMKGVDEQGRILLDQGENEIKPYYSHEVKWILQ